METERERIFREIYEDNIGRLYQYVLRRIGDVNYTEDTLQEVAVALLFHLNDFLLPEQHQADTEMVVRRGGE